jgi:hypothetical protein
VKSERSVSVDGVSRPLLWLGVLGLALSAVCIVIAGVRGVMVPPEGDLSKAITFNGAVGLFWITLGFFVPLAQFSSPGLRRWLVPVVGFTLYGYAIETIQTLRGLDPRFTRAGGSADVIAGIVFGVLAILLIGAFVVLIVKLARRGTDGPDGLVLLAFRYASVATMVAFAGWSVDERHPGTLHRRGGQHPAVARLRLPRAAGHSPGGVAVPPLTNPAA